MKLLQLNSWTLRIKDPLVTVIEREAADIVCLQEVLDHEEPLGLLPTLHQLQEKTGYAHAEIAPVYNLRIMQRTARYGNAVMGRLPLETRETIFTTGNYTDDFDYATDDYNIRNLQHVTVQHANGPVHVFNHHGLHVRDHKDGTPETLAACQKIVDAIAQVDGPVILTGDFNLTPESESIKLLERAGLRNLSVEYGLTTTRNYLTPKTEVCDYIFVNDQVTVKDFRMLDDVVSDHNALVVEFDV